MMERIQTKVLAVLVAVLGLVTTGPAEAQRSQLSKDLEGKHPCRVLCADTIADRYGQDEGYDVTSSEALKQVEEAEDIEESCRQCNKVEFYQGAAAAQRCYGPTGVGPPSDKSTLTGSVGFKQNSGTNQYAPEISMELAVPITVRLALTGSVGTESVLIPEGFLGVTAQSLTFLPSTHLGALSFGGDHKGLKAGDETRLGWLGLGAKLFVYRGIFLAAGVESYDSLESSTELSDRALRLGVGFQRMFSARWLVRGDLNYRFFDELDLDGPGVRVGIGFRFGKKPKKSRQLQEGVQ